MTANGFQWKGQVHEKTASDDPPSHNRKRRSQHVVRAAFLLLSWLLVLVIPAIGCRLLAGPGRSLGTPTSMLATPTSAAFVATPSPPPIQTSEREAMPGVPSFAFAALNAVPEDRANARNVDEIRTEFSKLKGLGVNIVVQAFASESTKADWQAYLDAAAQENLKAMGWFRRETPVWNGNSFDLRVSGEFLAAMKGHPALYAFFLLDEPFHHRFGWEITAERLQMLYQQAKEIAPNVPVAVHFTREIMLAEEKNLPQFFFRGGLCDICAISAHAFRNYGQGNVFDKDTVVSNQTISRAVIKREAPDVKIWTTIQVFGSATGTGAYYMPTAAELQQVVDLLFSPKLQAAGVLDGIVWQQWAADSEERDVTQYTLSDPEFEEHRRIVQNAARRLNLLGSP